MPREGELGALWVRKSKNGLEYMSGTISGQQVVCWRNVDKEAGDKQPDWRVMKSQPREK